MAFWKIRTGHVNATRDVLDYIGEIGHLFYSQDDNVIRISDGHTPGGIPLSGGSLTFSSATPPNNPQEGNLWYSTTDGRLYIYYDLTWVDASPDVQGAVTSIVAGSGISINTATGAVTISATGSGGGIALTDLSVGTPNTASGSGAISYNNTNGVFKYTPPDLSSYVTGTPWTSEGYATETWVNNQGFLTADNDSAYATTATVTSLIANSLTNYATTTYVNNGTHPAWAITSGTTSVTVDNDGSVTMSANSMLTAFNSDFNIQVANTSNAINVVGEFHVHSPAVLGITQEPIFRVKQDGQIRMLVPKLDAYEAGVGIVGSTTSNYLSPVNLGVMLQITGQQAQPSRIYNDSVNTYGAYVGRRYNGSTSHPTPLVKDDIIMRISAVGQTDTGMPNFGSSRISFVASENHTSANQGGRLEFWTNATGTNFLAHDLTVDSHGITFRDGTSQDTAAIPLTQKAVANGVATLDSTGKVPASQLAAGAVIYKGAWDANANLTAIGGYALSDTTPLGLESGWQYSVSVTGTRDIGNGTDTFTAGDYVTFNGTHWDRIPGASSGITSFNGRITPAAVLTTTDVINVLTPGSIATNRLAANSFTFNQGSGITVTNNGLASALGSSITISNVGVTSVTTGTGIRVSANTGTVVISYANDAGYITSSALTGYATQSWVGSQGYLTTATNYTLPTASTSTLGGVKVDGSTVSINGSGVISAIAAVNYYPVTKDVNLVGDTTFNFSFATDVYVRMKYDTALTIGFQDMSPGKVVSIVAVNTSNNSRTVTLGLAQGHATNSNASTVNISPGRMAMIRYVCFGTSSSDVYCEVSYQ